MMLGRGSLMIIDDLQHHSVGELVRLLEQQPTFELALDLGKTQIWRKLARQEFMPGHTAQPYLMSKTSPRLGRGPARPS